MARRDKATEAKWREQLTPKQYIVLRRKGTERPFSGEYVHTKDDGTYRCAGCGAELFSSETKFRLGHGLAELHHPAVAANVELHADNGLFMRRTEVTCARCGAPRPRLPRRPNEYDRYCINSVALTLDPEPRRARPLRADRFTAQQLPRCGAPSHLGSIGRLRAVAQAVRRRRSGRLNRSTICERRFLDDPAASRRELAARC